MPGLTLIAMLLLASSAWAAPQGALCRVSNRVAAATSIGSGTLVDKTDDEREGLVLTCAHLFSDGVGEIVVAFPGGKSHGAKLVAIDREADLAALAIANPVAEAASVSFELPSAQSVRACGFGPHGEYACAEGPIVGTATSAGQHSAMIAGAVRSGDSGGGVFDGEGNLVAVVWGESGGVTYASAGSPLKAFLDRVLGRRMAQVYRCPGGVCPRPAGPSITPPRTPPAEARSPKVDELEQRVAALERNKQDRGDFITRDEFGSLITNPIIGPSRKGGGFGIAGPAGWGVVALTTVGGWLVGRLWKRGAGGRRGNRFP